MAIITTLFFTGLAAYFHSEACEYQRLADEAETEALKLKKAKSEVKVSTVEKDEDKGEKRDPFERHGFGMMQYRNFMGGLRLVFLLMTLLTIPMMKIYSTGSAYRYESSWFAPFTLGNLGFS